MFKCVSEVIVRKVVKNLLSNKATAGEVSIKVLKISDHCFSKLTKCFR